MIDNTQTGVATIGIRLLVDAYVAWSRAETESEHTLRAWFDTTGEQAATAYLSYRTALDGEEAAANDLERLWQLYEPYAHTIVSASESVAK
jgi:hypothetical protein